MFLLPLLGIFCFDNILFVWLIMEMQIICYVCSLVLKVHKTNYILSFVLIQLFVGISLFYFSFLRNILNSQEYLVIIALLLNLFIKIGIYPFASWALKFINSLSGIDYWLFLTVIKVIPLVICFYTDNIFFLFLILTNWIYSCFILSYYSGYKKVIFFSSIANTSNFFCFFFIGFLSLAKIFLLFYFFFIRIIIFFLEKINYDFIFSGKRRETSFLLFLFIVSLVGIPFFWGFVTKLIFTISFFHANVLVIYFLAFMVSLIFSFFYIKLLFFFFVCNSHWSTQIGFSFFREKSLPYYLILIIFPLFVVSLFVMGNSFFI